MRTDYQACQKSVNQYSFYDENEKYMAAQDAYPCPIVRVAAEKKYNLNLMMDGFKIDLPAK